MLLDMILSVNVVPYKHFSSLLTEKMIKGQLTIQKRESFLIKRNHIFRETQRMRYTIKLNGFMTKNEVAINMINMVLFQMRKL